jgi:catechol 2,3-dioxygenase-like lactoylglutathione lyase family enzyme
MARLRHIAVVVKDIEASAKFYEEVFELRRVGREDLEIGSAVYMTDGVINMALLNFKGSAGSKASDLKEGSTFVGAHHFGFQVDDLADTSAASSRRAASSSSTSATSGPAISSASSRIRTA